MRRTIWQDVLEYRRRLPHFQPDNSYLFLTWRLHGSLPALRDQSAYRTAGYAFVAHDRALHRQPGPLWLQDHRVAGLVANTMQAGDRDRRYYELCAWVVMPNHVHMLALPLVPPPVFMKWVKGSTARQANALLRLTGRRFWQDESYDHYVRDERQFNRIVDYIEANPVQAGLVSSPEQWPWSSAGWTFRPSPAG